MKPDIRQVAAEAGVSTATVSRVLTGKGPASADAVRRVRAAAQRLHYQPSTSASSLRTERSMIIGVLVPNLANPVFLPFLRAVEHRAQQHGYAVIVADAQQSAEVERRQLDRLAAQRVDALVVAGRAPDPDALRQLADTGMPVADTETFAAERGGMVASLRPAVDEVCTHLASLGHTKVALLARGVAPGAASVRRWQLIESTSRRHGIDVELVLLGPTDDPDPARMAERLSELVTGPGGARALWSNSHALAPEVLEGLAVADLDLPGQVSFLTFGDSAWAAAYRPAINVITGDLASVAASMTTSLLLRLGVVGSVPDAAVELHAYRRRASVGRCPARP